MSEDNALLHRLTPLSAWALALGCIVGWGAFVQPGATFLPMAGPLGGTIAFCIAAVIMSIIALNFHFMMNRYSDPGGAFMFAGRVFGRNHGFVCGWFLALAYTVCIPLNATALALVGRNLMDNLFEVGFLYDVAGFDVYFGEVLLIVAVLGFFGYLVARSSKAAGTVQTLFAFCLVGGVLVVSLAAIANPDVTFQGMEPAFSPSVDPLVGIVSILVIAPWAFVGFDTLSQMTGELAFDVRKVGGIMVCAVVVGVGIHAALNLIGASVEPEGYANWAEYVAATPTLSGLEAIPVFYAVRNLMGSAGIIALDIATLGAILTGIVGFYMASGRLLYAMSRQDALPAWLSKLGKYHTPGNAIMTVFAIALVASFFGRTILTWVVDMTAVSSSIGFLYTSAAVWKLAKAENRNGWKVLGVIGAIASASCIFFLVVPNPLLGMSLQPESYVFLAAWTALGVNFYTPRYREKATKLEKGIRETAIES